MTRALTIALLSLALVLGTSCGGDDDGGGGGTEAGAAAPDEDVAAPDEVRGCLEEAGFDVETAATVEQGLAESLGIEDGLSIAGEGELVGLGTVTWYADADAAEEALEANAAVRTDEVAMGAIGRVTYDFAGGDRESSDSSAEIVINCL